MFTTTTVHNIFFFFQYSVGRAKQKSCTFHAGGVGADALALPFGFGGWACFLICTDAVLYFSLASSRACLTSLNGLPAARAVSNAVLAATRFLLSSSIWLTKAEATTAALSQPQNWIMVFK